jgi:AcrR family transcriptional regulator
MDALTPPPTSLALDHERETSSNAVSNASNATANALLDAAIACFEEFGLQGATTKRIAQRAGLNEVTLFRQFGNKQDLIRAVFEREAQLLASQALVFNGVLADDLAHVATGYHHLAQRRGRLIPVILTEVGRNPQLQQTFSAPMNLIGQILAMLEGYQRAGQLRQQPALQMYIDLVAPIMMGHIARQAFGIPADNWDANAYVKGFLDGHKAG